MSSTSKSKSNSKRDSYYPNTKPLFPPPRSRPCDSKPSELELLSIQKNQRQDTKGNNNDDDDRDLCMKKLSEFNEFLRRQGQSTSTKFRWDHLLPDNSGKAAAAANAKPEPVMQNERAATTYSLGPMGVGLTKENRFVDSKPPHLREMQWGFSNNGEDFRYPEVGNRGPIGEAVGFGGYEENLGFDSSSVISEMARNRIRRTEEATEFAYRKMESLRARASASASASASALDSIIDQIDGAGENRGVELHRRFPLPQEYMSEQNGAVLHGKRHQLGEDGSHHALTQRCEGFGAQGEEVVGFWMNHSESPKGAFFHGERQQVGENFGRVLPDYLYPDLKEKSRENEMELAKDILGRRMNHAQDQKGAFVHGESQQFQHYLRSKQENEDLASRMNRRRGQNRASLPDERQEWPEDYGRSLPQNYLDFVRESHVMEQTNDVFSPRINGPQAHMRALLTGERQGLTEDFGHSLPQHYHDFNVESQETQQENELLCSTMNNPLKPRGAPLHGENQQLQEDCDHSLPRHHLGLSGESYVMQQEGEVLASRVNHPQDQKGALFNGESQQLQHDCALESRLPKQDDNVYTTEGINEEISVTEELGINSRSLKPHPKKRIIDLRKIKESRISALPRILDASNDEILDIGYEGEQWNDEEELVLLRKSGFESPQDARAILFDELPSQRNIIDCNYQFSSLHMQEFAQPSDRKNVKQRLGQPYQVHCDGKNIKHRLGPSCQVRSPNHMLQVKRHTMKKPLKKKVVDFHQEVQRRDVHLPDVKCRRTDLPENSEEFKQLIDGAFFQFVKALNENPAQRRKYTEKGEAETLKCCVCGSKSKEFVSTLSLVLHAFTSQMVGLRVHHLGLHKALCFLMGWDSMPASNSLWRQKTLPDAEALAMKEDLVIWPPVVIWHNSSIATTNSNDWIIVSIEELEAFLGDMGFGRGITKVCRGKAANQSIMTVIFHGTFSGLQEAERLHKLYAENKHGRAEFQRINCRSGETQKVPVDKVEDVLFGYLGIACDLHELDFETKSRAVVKSKKEIYAIAEALLDNE